jgi:hypothetical protein
MAGERGYVRNRNTAARIGFTMKFRTIAAATLALACALPSSAQTVPDDVRCLMLSNLFTKAATEDQAKQVARQSLAFYLGRLDGRATPQALTAAMRAQAPTIDPKAAGPAMNACTARLAKAEQAVQAAGRAVSPTK